MKFREALHELEILRAAFVGAGGKTTTMFSLAREYPQGCIVSTSTHLGWEQCSLADQHLIIEESLQKISLNNLARKVTLITGKRTPDNKAAGLNSDQLTHLKDLADNFALPLLIEADGSRQLPLKAPAEHEPAIPQWVDFVFVVQGMNGIGMPLNRNSVHRWEKFSCLTGIKEDEPISASAIGTMLKHDEGGLKNIPPGARRIAVLNQSDNPSRMVSAAAIAKDTLTDFNAVWITSMIGEARLIACYEPVSIVLLAAGGSTRFGSPKALADWKGMPLIRHMVHQGINSLAQDVLVVLGNQAEHLADSIHDYQSIRILVNQNWEEGQSSSVKFAIQNLPPKCGAALFMLVDQPFIDSAVLDAVIENFWCHRENLILAPDVDGKRGNPFLFDRLIFPDFVSLKGDVGGRSLFEKYRVGRVPWLDNRIFLDIDTPDDFQRLREM